MVFTGSKVDRAECQRMLDNGKSVREIAENQRVSRQAVYGLIRRGTLTRPSKKQSAPVG